MEDDGRNQAFWEDEAREGWSAVRKLQLIIVVLAVAVGILGGLLLRSLA